MTPRQRARHFAQYMTGGMLYFWSGYAVFAICYSGLRWWWFWSKVAADLVGWTLNYLVQRYWTFAHDRAQLRERKHIARYLAVEAVGLVLDYAIIAGLNAVGISPYIGFFVSAAFFTVWSYAWYRFWVFPRRR